MDANFKLILPDGQPEITGDTINWVTWNPTGGGLKAAHDAPAKGRSLIVDMQTMPLDVLLSLSENNYQGLDKIRTKSVYKYLSKPIISIDEKIREPKLETIKFTTEDGQFTLLIKTNPVFRGRSPFSLG